MITQRYGHGICYLNGTLYVAGGVKTSEDAITLCEKYDIIKGTWEEFPSLEKPRFAMTLVAMDSRYIYQFGGHE